MSIVGDAVHWFEDGDHWSGPDGVPHRLLVHLGITGAAVGIALVIALPLAVSLGHMRRLPRLGDAIVALSNTTRALPVFGLLIVLAATPLGVRNRTTIVALTVFAIPPLLSNAYVGMRGVDPDVVEAARGNGMSGMQVLRAVELPLALPLIAAGLRTSAVQVVATATLASYVGGGGLGQFISQGFGSGDRGETVAGGVLVAVLALAMELALAGVQRALTPPAATRL